MSTCELCGTDNVTTYKTTTSGARVDACARCIDRLGLTKPSSPINQGLSNPKPTKVRVTGSNIMHKPEQELAPDFHKRIKIAREEKGWDQREFARRMNERLNIVQRIENGNRPTDALIKKIEKVLDVELLIESIASNSRQISTQGTRNMTIGDAYENLFSGRE
ncbi:MAG: helix-turn-helix domain-containing protein [Candidatus Thalassarchaeaceae archaeon]